MKIDLTDLSPVKKAMSVEVDADEVERETESLLRHYRQKARIPGFRPGKAPISVIRTRFAKELQEDVRERVVSRYFAQAAHEKGLTPLGDPALEDMTHETGKPLSFKTTFEVLPVIEVKNHRGIEVRRPIVTVTDEDLERALEELRQSRARLVVEEGRLAVSGDVVVTDVVGTPEDGEPFEREHMPVEVGAENNLAAFNEHLLGVRSGDVREFAMSYPADYQAKELAGKRVDYRLSVCEVKRREIPTLDDEFAKDLGDFEDLATLRVRVREDLEKQKRHEADQVARQALLDKLLIENPVVLPETLVEQEVLKRLEQIVRNMYLQGIDAEKAEIDWIKVRKQQEEPARKSVHARLVIDALSRLEAIEVDDAALDARIERDAERLGESAAKLRARLSKHHGTQALRAQMVREKTLDYLTSVANIH